jgi:Flp pilus assembly protein TadG
MIFYKYHLRLSKFTKASTGSVALEFGLLAPIFVALVLGILEIALVLLVNLYLTDAANSGVDYLRRSAIDRVSVTDAKLREIIAAHMPIPLAPDRLKVALVPIENSDLATSPLQYPVVNAFSTSSTAGQYLLQIGYDWPMIVPTTRYLIPYTGNTPQLQTTVIAVTAVRVTE